MLANNTGTNVKKPYLPPVSLCPCLWLLVPPFFILSDQLQVLVHDKNIYIDTPALRIVLRHVYLYTGNSPGLVVSRWGEQNWSGCF